MASLEYRKFFEGNYNDFDISFEWDDTNQYIILSKKNDTTTTTTTLYYKDFEIADYFSFKLKELRDSIESKSNPEKVLELALYCKSFKTYFLPPTIIKNNQLSLVLDIVIKSNANAYPSISLFVKALARDQNDLKIEEDQPGFMKYDTLVEIPLNKDIVFLDIERQKKCHKDILIHTETNDTDYKFQEKKIGYFSVHKDPKLFQDKQKLFYTEKISDQQFQTGSVLCALLSNGSFPLLFSKTVVSKLFFVTGNLLGFNDNRPDPDNIKASGFIETIKKVVDKDNIKKSYSAVKGETTIIISRDQEGTEVKEYDIEKLINEFSFKIGFVPPRNIKVDVQIVGKDLYYDFFSTDTTAFPEKNGLFSGTLDKSIPNEFVPILKFFLDKRIILDIYLPYNFSLNLENIKKLKTIKDSIASVNKNYKLDPYLLGISNYVKGYISCIIDSFDALPKKRTSFPPPPTEKKKSNVTIIVIGPVKTGKTQLLKRYLLDSFDEDYTPTEDFQESSEIETEIDGKTVGVTYFDYSGNYDTSLFEKEIWEKHDGIMLVYDITNKESFRELGKR